MLFYFFSEWGALVVGIFETVVAVFPIIICFQSLILDMAGNVGTQSLAVTIRALMDENLTSKQKFTLVSKVNLRLCWGGADSGNGYFKHGRNADSNVFSQD